MTRIIVTNEMLSVHSTIASINLSNRVFYYRTTMPY